MLTRYGMPLLVAGLLIGAGVAMLLIEISVAGRSCGGAIAVLARPVEATRFSHECHATARIEAVFGAGAIAAGLLAGLGGTLIMRRTRPSP